MSKGQAPDISYRGDRGKARASRRDRGERVGGHDPRREPIPSSVAGGRPEDDDVVKAASQTQAGMLVHGDHPTVAKSTIRWGTALSLVVGLHVGLGIYLTSTIRDALDGTPQEAISIDMVPDPSDQNAKLDDVAGPAVADASAATSEQVNADDPDPPAPDAAAATTAKKEPDVAPDLTAPPAPADAQALLPPMEKSPEKPVDRPPDPKPPVEDKPEVKEKMEHPTAPSQASSGSAALLSGGKRPSAAAQATWRGEIGTHLVKNRRYPQAARSQGMQGVAKVQVTIDAKGHVLDEKLIETSGRQLLDGEALALMKRADPFPEPPAGMPAPVTMTVPVNFSIR